MRVLQRHGMRSNRYAAAAAGLWLGMLAGGVCAAQRVAARPAAAEAALQRGLRAERDGQMSLAVAALGEAANHGSAAAMRELGDLYTQGRVGSVRSLRLGLQWYQRAVAAGDAESIYSVGLAYQTGWDGSSFPQLAQRWWQQGEQQKDGRCAVSLAELAGAAAGHRSTTAQRAEQARLLKEAEAWVGSPGWRGGGDDVWSWRQRLGAQELALARELDRLHQPAQAELWWQAAAGHGQPEAAIHGARLKAAAGTLSAAKAGAALLDGYRDDYGEFPMPLRPQVTKLEVRLGAIAARAGDAGRGLAQQEFEQAAQDGEAAPAVGYLDQLWSSSQRLQVPTKTASLTVAKDLALSLQSQPMSPALKGRYVRELQRLAKAYESETQTNEQAQAVSDLQAALQQLSPLTGTEGGATLLPPPPPPLAEAGVARRPPPRAEQTTAVPAAVVPSYPSLVADATVAPQQTFPVIVSLGSTPGDAGMKVLSSNGPGGQMSVLLPAGMQSAEIEVDLVAVGMTVTDGSSRKLELDRSGTSLPAIFHVQAGATAGTGTLVASLSYNGVPLALVQRAVTVASSNANAQTQIAARAATNTVVAPAPNPPPTTLESPIGPGGLPSPHVGVAPLVLHAIPPINPERQAPDMTIQEVKQTDGSLLVMVSSPNMPSPPFESTVVLQRSSLDKQIQDIYQQLQTSGNNLGMLGGASRSLQAKVKAEGLGASLYANPVAASFRKVYEYLLAHNEPPQMIEVETSEPTVPWELLRVPDASGQPQFLGMVASMVHVTTSATPRVQSPQVVAIQAVDLVIPDNSSNVALPATKVEQQALQTNFGPQLKSVAGTSDGLIALAQQLPQSIIHYAGHGLLVPQGIAPADLGLSLGDGTTMTPATWVAMADQSQQQANPPHPFYFFNACYQGQAQAVQGYVSGWAPQLLASGASGFLGALWEVDDATAASFSKHFYQDMKARMSAGGGQAPEAWYVADVVRQARAEAYAEHNNPAALAYVLYAQPYLTLRLSAPAASGAGQAAGRD